mmetsp:Transcript_1395/g.3091  ORF Transcript_1395/g.3091 Transcript_1395/m.3091 type:complete len:307 (-) Transcript_1395:21-941(-)
MRHRATPIVECHKSAKLAPVNIVELPSGLHRQFEAYYPGDVVLPVNCKGGHDLVVQVPHYSGKICSVDILQGVITVALGAVDVEGMLLPVFPRSRKVQGSTRNPSVSPRARRGLARHRAVRSVLLMQLRLELLETCLEDELGIPFGVLPNALRHHPHHVLVALLALGGIVASGSFPAATALTPQAGTHGAAPELSEGDTILLRSPPAGRDEEWRGRRARPRWPQQHSAEDRAQETSRTSKAPKARLHQWLGHAARWNSDLPPGRPIVVGVGMEQFRCFRRRGCNRHGPGAACRHRRLRRPLVISAE